ncbi:MAG: glycosyltransferase family 2 protein [Gammaproteobacteria bacterium]|nr:glycosyltransferase family 2 protein [Gammaproteobacteria bacterium]MBU1732201.1 glycosyltransferase family 2 protein [Gammaproteobacteria bacterium]MBU1893269.1 glycosyltransferase family 2 protein [Gammaproteobacteria bacterium]
MTNNLKVALCVPVLNPGNAANVLLGSVAQQECQPDEVLIVDSDSDDDSVELFRAAGAKVVVISRTEFDHGGTRQMAVEILPHIDIIVFMTQDAVLAGREDLKKLLACFKDENVGAAYGRQLPFSDAGEVEAHARFFNYPERSRIKGMSDISELGIKTAFISNSFAAYRRSVLMAIGGFPRDLILGEDTYVAARLLLSGWKVAYCAEAQVYHSHDLTLGQEFRRYFDIGVFHGRESWLRREFGQPHGEGARFVKSEFNYLRVRNPILVPFALARNVIKLLAFRLGLMERYLPLWLKLNLGWSKAYWERSASSR